MLDRLLLGVLDGTHTKLKLSRWLAAIALYWALNSLIGVSANQSASIKPNFNSGLILFSRFILCFIEQLALFHNQSVSFQVALD